MTITKTLKVNEIAAFLQISRTKAYELVNSNLFPVIHIGKALRVPYEPFEQWYLSDCAGIFSASTGTDINAKAV